MLKQIKGCCRIVLPIFNIVNCPTSLLCLGQIQDRQTRDQTVLEIFTSLEYFRHKRRLLVFNQRTHFLSAPSLSTFSASQSRKISPDDSFDSSIKVENMSIFPTQPQLKLKVDKTVENRLYKGLVKSTVKISTTFQ